MIPCPPELLGVICARGHGHISWYGRVVPYASEPMGELLPLHSTVQSSREIDAGRAGRTAMRSDRAELLVVGTGPGLATLESLPAAGHDRVVGVVGRDPGAVPAGWSHLGPLEMLGAHLESGRFDQVAICLDEGEWSMTDSLVGQCIERGIDVLIPIPAFGESRRRTRHRHGLAAAVKRSVDIMGALAGLVVLAPVLAAAAVAIVMDDGRPVLFRQQRAGLDGRPFSIAKFRTMRRRADAERAALRVQNEVAGGASFKMTNDPRVTRLGRWLRRTSIDELPQLWNVLKGEMSLVGPRPHPFDDVAGYRPWHLQRLAAKPGITGLWQTELRSDPDFDRWVAKDIEYIERWSLWLDARILAKTIPALVRGEGR
jgi:lipopolysaccharide/colanic/teichoic acid biosynthesis glycosyltransferase